MIARRVSVRLNTFLGRHVQGVIAVLIGAIAVVAGLIARQYQARPLISSLLSDFSAACLYAATLGFIWDYLQSKELVREIVDSIRVHFQREPQRFLRPLIEVLARYPFFIRDYEERVTLTLSPDDGATLAAHIESRQTVSNPSDSEAEYTVVLMPYGEDLPGRPPRLTSLRLQQKIGDGRGVTVAHGIKLPHILTQQISKDIAIPAKGLLYVETEMEDHFRTQDSLILKQSSPVDGVRLIVEVPKGYFIEAFPLHSREDYFEEEPPADGRRRWIFSLSKPLLPGNGIYLKWRPE